MHSDTQPFEFKAAPNEIALISDMTGTLIRQTKDGFPKSRRALLRNLIERGGFLAVITNDSFETVEEYFNVHLGTLSAPYYIVSGGGFEGYRVENSICSKIFVGREISRSGRATLNQKICELLSSLLHIQPPFSDYTLDSFQTDSGARVSIAHLDHRFKPLSFCESVRSKVAIFFLDYPIAPPLEQSIFDAIENDPTVKKILGEEQLFLTRGANYLDITSCIKSDGVTSLLANPEISRFRINDRNIILMGDSLNDESLLCFPIYSSKALRRIFLGEDVELSKRLKHSFPLETILFYQGYTDAAERYLQRVIAPLAHHQ